MKKTELMNLLKDFKMEIIFEKVDGTKRKMLCTLKSDLIKDEQTTSGSGKKPNDNVISVWDLDKNDWRSFRINKVLEAKVL